jgi:hypothetical protein
MLLGGTRCWGEFDLWLITETHRHRSCPDNMQQTHA